MVRKLTCALVKFKIKILFSTWHVCLLLLQMINSHSMSVFKNTVMGRLVGGRKCPMHNFPLYYTKNIFSYLSVHPASKQRSEGEKVRVGDDLILVSVATERYLVRWQNISIQKYVSKIIFIAHHKRKRLFNCQCKFSCYTLVSPTIWYEKEKI